MIDDRETTTYLIDDRLKEFPHQHSLCSLNRQIYQYILLCRLVDVWLIHEIVLGIFHNIIKV